MGSKGAHRGFVLACGWPDDGGQVGREHYAKRHIPNLSELAANRSRTRFRTEFYKSFTSVNFSASTATHSLGHKPPFALTDAPLPRLSSACAPHLIYATTELRSCINVPPYFVELGSGPIGVGQRAVHTCACAASLGHGAKWIHPVSQAVLNIIATDRDGCKVGNHADRACRENADASRIFCRALAGALGAPSARPGASLCLTRPTGSLYHVIDISGLLYTSGRAAKCAACGETAPAMAGPSLLHAYALLHVCYSLLPHPDVPTPPQMHHPQTS